jgi:flagellar hook-associated protein 3 FlgL
VSLKEELFSVANTTYLGRTVFAGNSDAGVAFADPIPPSTTLQHTGPGTPVERRINGDTMVRVDADGAAVFGTAAISDPPDPNASVFSLIDTIVADLRSNVNVGPRIGEIDARLNAIVGQHTAVGARHAQIQRAQEANMEQSVSLEAQRSGIEDVDIGQIILDLKLQEVTYQSALAVTARVLQPTLTGSSR